jgi:dCMP deaminase
MDWNMTFMNITKEFAKHSKCSAKQVACILVIDNNIVSIGINGTLPGKPNCNELFKKENNEWFRYVDQVDKEKTLLRVSKNHHHEWSCINEIHAEINAISKANKKCINLERATAYITHSPCFNCAKTLAVFGIKEIYFETEYDDFDVVKEFLEDNDIKITKI